MWKNSWVVFVLVGAFAFPGFAVADEATGDRETIQKQEQEQEQVYGSQMMTPGERSKYREKIRAAKTREEREQIRKEHHELMKERARERGLALPDEPPPVGGGMGPKGGGMGSGGKGGR